MISSSTISVASMPNRLMNIKAQWQIVNRLHQEGKLVEAESVYREILKTQADHPEATHMLGMLLHQRGESGQALDYLDRSLILSGEQAPLLANMAKVHIDIGHPDTALDYAERALELQPHHFGAWLNRALAYRQMGKASDALWALDHAGMEQPDNARVLLLRASTLFDLQQYGECRAVFQRALHRGADRHECIIGIAASWAHEQHRKQALQTLSGVKPEEIVDTGAVFRGAKILQKLKAWLDAVDWLNEVISRETSHVEAILRRGLFSGLVGDAQGAVDDYRRVLDIDPSYQQVHSNLLGRLQYDCNTSAADILHAHQAWAARHANHEPKSPNAFINTREKDRQLNIGWISPRFNSSITDSFLTATLQSLPEIEFRHFFYSSRKAAEHHSSALAKLGSWRMVDGLTDPELAQLVSDDGIDLLIDLAGHNPGNRLIAISGRLAPVQISWLDYYSTTGVPAVDYWITDRYLTPEGHEQFFTEKLIYLPDTRMAYSPPAVSVLPGRSERSQTEITFGSFNRLGKLTDPVIELWSKILDSCENSRLLLKASEFLDQAVREHTLVRLNQAGIPLEKIELRPESPIDQMLREYADIDIALDPFSFTGCATSCDALWMGVPLITLAGDSVVSRQGLSILSNIGKTEWVARNQADYQRIAIELAKTIISQGFDRHELRQCMETSPMCDNASQALALSRSLREAWTGFCEHSS